MKKLALLLAVCLLLQCSPVAFATDLPDVTPDLTVEQPEEQSLPDETPAEEPAEEPTEEIVEEPAEEPAEEPTEEIVEEPAEEPTEEPAEEPTEEPAEEPSEELTEEAVDELTGEPAEEAEEEEESEEESEEAAFAPGLARLAAETVIYTDAAMGQVLAIAAEDTVVYAAALEEGLYTVEFVFEGESYTGFVPADALTLLGEDEAEAWAAAEHSEDALVCGGWVLEPMLLLESVDSLLATTDFTITGGIVRDYKGSSAIVNIPSVDEKGVAVTGIANGAFKGKTNIQIVTIPESVTTIGSSAFDGCVNLVSVNIPTGVTKIEANTFRGCSLLTSIVLVNVETIGTSAFANCYSLASVAMVKVKTVGDQAFEGCASLQGMVLPTTLTEIGTSAFSGCVRLSSINFPENLETIGDSAFASCAGMAVVDLSTTKVTAIGAGAFSDCTGLNKVVLPETGLTTLERGTFQNCASLGEIVLPKAVTVIGAEAFMGCAGLTGVDIRCEAGLTILSDAFAGAGGNAKCAVFITSQDSADYFEDNCFGGNCVLYCNAGSPAELYARNHGLTTRDIKIVDYVKRCYEKILGREGELSGVVYWTNAMTVGITANGSTQIYGGGQIVVSFINSQEFMNLGLSNTDIVKCLYRAMLGREADAPGLADWVEHLDKGMSPDYVVNGFVGSTEFLNNVCLVYGVQPGTVTLTQARDRNKNVTFFVSRCYKLLLERDFDVAGLNDWCEQVNNGKQTGATLVDNFVCSQEFTIRSKDMNSEKQVQLLYQTMLDRKADDSGLAYWVNVLDNFGVSLRAVETGMAGSIEFDRLCWNYGILTGKLPDTSRNVTLDARDVNYYMTKWITEIYGNCFPAEGNVPAYAYTEDDLNYNANLLLNNKPARDLVAEYIFSDRCAKRESIVIDESSPAVFAAHNKNFLLLVYKLYWGMDETEALANGYFNDWLTRLNNKNISRWDVVGAFGASDQFNKFIQDGYRRPGDT